MTLSDTLSVTRALFLFPAQLLGGIIAAALVSCMFRGPITPIITILGPQTR